MSDVLIRGMEMPKDGCHHMVCIYADGTVSTGGRVYMAVPVPPHGRLIDADNLMLKIKDYIEEYSEIDEQGWHGDKWCAMKETETAINDAQTVIPADGKDTDVPTREEEV